MNTANASHQKLCIAGERVEGDTGRSIEVINPFTQAVVGTVPRASRKQVADAFAAAAGYRPQLSRYQRQQILSKTAQLLAVAKDWISDLITAESGLSKKDSLYEVGRACDVFNLTSQLCIIDDGEIYSCDLTPTARKERFSRSASR